MEIPPDHPSVANGAEIESSDRKVVRRRFVQTTLFPLKPHDGDGGNCSQKEVKKAEEVVIEVSEEDICGSQGGNKKRRKPKGSTTPQKRGSKKVDDNSQVEVIADDDDDCGGGEEVCGSQGGKRKRGGKIKGNSTPQKRASKKAAVNGKDAFVVAIDDANSPDDGSPQQLKSKQRVSTKNGKANGDKAISMSKASAHLVASQQSSQPVPDLWLEAKKTAEENSRIFAGKQIHPFFSSWKAGKKDLETIDVENYGCLGQRKERNVEFGPVHVFENAEDDSDSIDWSNWTFDDGIFSKTTCNQERKYFSTKGTVGSFECNDILTTSNPPKTSLLLKDECLTQLCGSNEDSSVILLSLSPIILDEKVAPCDPLKNIEEDIEVSKACVHDNAGSVRSHTEQQNSVLQERVMSYHHNRCNYPDNSLWANKYHPQKALEVCGNSDAVKFINDWLRLWHATDFRFSKSSYSADHVMKNNVCNSYDSGSDDETVEETSGLKNVLLVTGPVGSGKSAAIYACAKEQGFQVIEVNASDWRNGARLKQKFGEAVGSHWIKRSQESPSGKLSLMPSPVFTNGAAVLDLNNGVAEVVTLLEEEDCVGDVASQNYNNCRLPCDKSDIKTLILFEDVDVTLCDDRGFISTIQQLAEIGKRPMILTSNNESPLLPDNLDREEVCFTMPSLKELAHHIYLVCSAEKANIHPDLIERCVEFCKGDIRKILMNLQFWCQSKECIEDGRMQSIPCHLMFNLEASHCILPKLIPWELPSLLSEFVEAEVAKSCMKMEENHSMIEVIEEEELGNTSNKNKHDFDIGKTASIEAKKDAIISRNCLSHVDNDILAGSNTCEFSNSSGSPVAFARRNIRRKSDTVLSESEDEICGHENPVVSDDLFGNAKNNLTLAVQSQFPVLHSSLEGMSKGFDEQPLHSRATDVAVINHPSETAHVNLINFFTVGNSSNQSMGPVLPEEEKNQHLEFVDANCSGNREANDSLNLLNGLLVHAGDGSMVVNMWQSPVMDREKFLRVCNSRNQSADQPFYFGEANGVEIGTGNAANLCLHPSSDQVEQWGEANNAVKRCLFPHSGHADPISGAIGSPRNQSTGHFIPCIEASVAEHQDFHLELETMNHDCLVAADASLNPVFDQLLFCHQEDMEISELQHLQTANANPLCYTALGDSLNPSNDQLFDFVETKEKEIQNQHTDVGDRNPNCCAALDGHFNKVSDKSFGTAKPEKNQQQHPQTASVNYASCRQLDDSLKQLSGQFNCEEEKTESVQHQLPNLAIADLISCPAVDNSLNPSDGKIMTFFEAEAEEQQYQYSDATNANNVIDLCPSVDMFYVPDSTYVPEREVNSETECLSGIDLMEIVSPVAIENLGPSNLGHQASKYRLCDIDINVNVRDEETGDSQSENDNLDPSTSRMVMDECSRMDFFKRSALKLKNSVQARWNELRQADLTQYTITEHKNGLELVELGYRMSNLISEGDLLLYDREFLIDDSSCQETGLSEETYAFGWHGQQVQMAFSIARYGYLLYAKDIDALQSKMGLDNKLQLGWEMLALTCNSMALGKLLSLNRCHNSSAGMSIKRVTTTFDASFKREREMSLHNIVQSVVPLRSYLTVRGTALHDYLSSLAQISRSESSRLAKTAEKTKRRRVRFTKNYLSNGVLDFSQDDISFLNEYDFCRRDSSKLTHETSM